MAVVRLRTPHRGGSGVLGVANRIAMTSLIGLVSAIVPTKNSAATLDACLESLRKQLYPTIEIIVVDNYSTDRTEQIALAHGCAFYKCGPERSTQVNFGSKVSRGEFIYRIDSDCTAAPEVIAECVAHCRDGAELVSVPCVTAPADVFWQRVRAFERAMYVGDEFVVGARFFRRSAFEQLRGFDEELVAGEDYDIHNRALRAGMNVVVAKFGELNHGDASSLAEIASKAFIYGRQLPAFVAKNADRAFAQLQPFRGAYLRNAADFARHPALASGLIAMQAVKYAFGAAGYLIGMIAKRRPVETRQED
uniref:Glycosyltransferase 2-like domain-containing protein n=1 Tax=mine drainage metagenome TaxID=410659 RepID=E6Q513_9ZZZZ